MPQKYIICKQKILNKDHNNIKCLKIGITKEERHSLSNGFCIYTHDRARHCLLQHGNKQTYFFGK